MNPFARPSLFVAMIATILAMRPARAADPAPYLKHVSFDRDPHWEGWNNHVTPAKLPTVVQDFGFSLTHFATANPGELGGVVTRASEPAFYAVNIGNKTLDEPLSASGTLALEESSAGGGMFFGFFNARQPGASGRPVGSLGIDMDCETHGGRIAVRMINAANQSCGTFVTPFIPGKFRPTPIRNDGTRYQWTLAYDPHANNANGRFTFSLTSDAHQPDEISAQPGLADNFKQEADRRFPHTTTFAVDLPPGFKEQSTVFDHFGLMNMMKAGGRMKIYFGDLKVLGQPAGFSHDPGWDAAGNRITYQAKDVGGAHDFGFSNTAFAGGDKPGEIGGTFWRSDHWAYYADNVGTLSFENRLEARGKISLAVGAPDSDMCVGWFHADRTAGSPDKNSPDKGSPDKASPFIGIKIGGPTRVGHYFLPIAAFTPESRALPKTGPVLKLGESQDWALVYDPAAHNGAGSLTATLDAQSVTLDLRAGQKALAKDATLDHFGLVSIGPGGQIVKVYIDDLQYTSAR
jgi:hypothetical protein